MVDLIGQYLGRYHILEQIGQGGMAIVYKAYDTRLETDVAVKVIRMEALPQNAVERSLKRFEREAKALARLTHPNIVKVTDYGEYEEKPYLVMPYLPGGTLKQKLGRPIPWREALALIQPIAGALDYAHEMGMIHRDVKPGNILLTAKGQALLTDFGIAKVISNEETMDLTGTGLGVGTPEYMAPEQWTNQTVPQSDIYGLGVVLYEMITGRKPYVADTPAALLLKQANDPLPRPGQFVAELPAPVEELLLKAMARRVEERFTSMASFSTRLQELIAAPEMTAPRPAPSPKPKPVAPSQKTAATPPGTALPPILRSPWLWLGLGLVFLAGVGLPLLQNITGVAPVPVSTESIPVPVPTHTSPPQPQTATVVPTDSQSGPERIGQVLTIEQVDRIFAYSFSTRWRNDDEVAFMVDEQYWVYQLPDRTLFPILDHEAPQGGYDMAFIDQTRLIIYDRAGNDKRVLRVFERGDGGYQKLDEMSVAQVEGWPLLATGVGDLVAIPDGQGVSLYDSRENLWVKTLSGLEESPAVLYFLDNGQAIAYGLSHPGGILVRSVSDGALLASLRGELAGVISNQTSLVGFHGIENGWRIYRHDLDTDQSTTLLEISNSAYDSFWFGRTVQLSENGNLLAYSPATNALLNYEAVALFDLVAEEPLASFEVSNDYLLYPDGSAIAFLRDDGSSNFTTEVYDSRSGTMLFSLPGRLWSISPGGKYGLVSVGNILELWNIQP